DGRASMVILDDSGGAGITWPWAWYLRHQGIGYLSAEQIQTSGVDPRAIVIRTRGERAAPQALVERSNDVVVYRHRWWFPEEGYRSMTWERLRGGVLDVSLVREWAAFAWDRGDRDRIASLDGEVYFPR
ncbi:MAG: hypothetical protein O2822_06005, partial [Chloroflexi bacterium]|nr:hypothetical protein [Chloroflexota bacterium]